MRELFCASYAFVAITLPDSPMVSQREKFSSSVANAIDSYFCGLAEAQAFCICVSEERSGRLEVTALIPLNFVNYCTFALCVGLFFTIRYIDLVVVMDKF